MNWFSDLFDLQDIHKWDTQTLAVINVVCLNRSSYVLFVRDSMKKRKSSDFNSNTGSFKDLAQIWSKLSLQEKQQYKCLYDAEWQQYWRDVALFKQVSSSTWLLLLLYRWRYCSWSYFSIGDMLEWIRLFLALHTVAKGCMWWSTVIVMIAAL